MHNVRSLKRSSMLPHWQCVSVYVGSIIYMLHKITLQHFSKAQAGTCLLGLNRDLPPPLPSLFKNASDANAKASPGTGKFKPQSSFCKRCCVLPLHLQTEHYVDIKIAFFFSFSFGVFLTGDYILRGCSAGKVSQCVCICLLPLLSLLFLENAKWAGSIYFF